MARAMRAPTLMTLRRSNSTVATSWVSGKMK